MGVLGAPARLACLLPHVRLRPQGAERRAESLPSGQACAQMQAPAPARAGPTCEHIGCTRESAPGATSSHRVRRYKPERKQAALSHHLALRISKKRPRVGKPPLESVEKNKRLD